MKYLNKNIVSNQANNSLLSHVELSHIENQKSEIRNPKFRCHILVLICSIVYGLWSQPTFAQYTLKSKLDTNQYLIGDHIPLHITATYDTIVEARFPQFSKSIKIGEKEIDYLDSIAIVTDVKGKI